jgi:hypothetical protein
MQRPGKWIGSVHSAGSRPQILARSAVCVISLVANRWRPREPCPSIEKPDRRRTGFHIPSARNPVAESTVWRGIGLDLDGSTRAAKRSKPKRTGGASPGDGSVVSLRQGGTPSCNYRALGCTVREAELKSGIIKPGHLSSC